MLSSHRDAKSLSCDSLFYERSSLKRKFPSGLPSGTSNISFKNDDYNYLINCNELITTCKEALLENEAPVISNITNIAAADEVCVPHEEGFLSVQQTQETQKNSFAEFVKWLSYTEHQLETICYCANTKILTDWPDIISHHKAIQSEIENVGRRFINDIKSNTSGNVNSVKTKLSKEERRWHSLWLRSLEYLMILEEGPHCPQHYNNNSNINNGVDEHLMPSKRHKSSVGIVSNSGGIRNKRVQTTAVMVGETRNELFNNLNGKYEVIQKDIGYSSDADMSDAVETHPPSDKLSNLSNRSVRRRRRRSRAPRTRPWSFHSDWTDWDYYQTPLNYNGDYMSSEDFYGYDDDKTVRNLIEFGENYESWISPEDDDDLIRVSSPIISQEADNETKHLDEPSPTVAKEEHLQNTTKHSTMHFTFTIFIYVTLAIFALAITITNYSPHIQKLYPHRPPPI